jgi:hypothetical protein
VLAHLVHDRLAHRALAERRRPVGGDGAQHGGQLGVLQLVTNRVWLAVGLVEVGGCHWVGFERGFGGEQGVQPRADRKALLGQLNRRLEQPRPRQLAVLTVRQRQHGHGAGHAHRAPAHHRLHERNGFAVGAKEQRLIGRRRRGFAAVESLHPLAVVVQQKGTATDAAGLRLYQREYHLHRHRRVHRAAAGAQYLHARFGRQRVGRGHRLALECPARLGRDARGRFGRRWRGWARAAASGKQREPKAGAQAFESVCVVFHVTLRFVLWTGAVWSPACPTSSRSLEVFRHAGE